MRLDYKKSGARLAVMGVTTIDLVMAVTCTCDTACFLLPLWLGTL
jgi:hypothetical protein